MGLLGGFIARSVYYPSILWNAITNKITGRTWYNRINDHIILGAIPMKFMTEELSQNNVKGVISLNEDYELRYIYNSEEKWGEHGIKLLRLATQDLFAAPSIPDIKSAIQFIETVKAENGSVYVHCKAGKTRSTTVAVCYLIHSEGMTPEQAYEHIQSKRPQVWLRKPQFDCIQTFYNNGVR